VRLAITSIALVALLTSPAFATFCKEKTTDGGTEPIYGEVNKIVGTTPPGPSGWDGVGGQCKKPGSNRIWVGPRDANGVCLTPASLVGSQGGAIIKKVIEKIGDKDLPDIVEHRDLELKVNWVEKQWRGHTIWVPKLSLEWSELRDGGCKH
jgi:hypothetical protein